ncbi:MAG: hypothetical protein K5793_01605 [Nitrosarchaeum sp.]|nr:hypothetical protein [Nitrosarchaeum sp.]
MFYGFVMPVHAQSPEDCESDQVWQGNACVDAVDAPDNDLNVKTNQVLYGQGGVVVVSGLIHNFANLSPSDVTIIVRAPDNNIVTVAQVHPAADGSFQTSFKADGPQFKAPGDYTIFASFPGLTSEITFEFTGGSGDIISGGDSKPLTCPSGQTLVNGKCIVPEPKEPLTCPPGEELVNGKCIVPEPKEPLTCPPGEELVNGMCIVPEPEEPVCGPGTELVNGMCQIVKTDEKPGGGCLIATAAYGTELAPQVQFLREIRDNTVMSTSSGSAFMTGFNQLYYSFSPTIADMERENPLFQQAVRAFITPMISSLSIMTLAEDGSEAQVLGLGLSVIALNLGMYIAAPALIGFKVHRHFKTRN